ncbi:MAG: glycoside hydrolase family 3 C-terminal domain-containing protein [Propionibacteriaceae bacterium]|nr:glycoside hydrolase family 3 C-terminal domain-containing protein [Propionibacteriaceae bacterium]
MTATSTPMISQRVQELMATMTLKEKLAQLQGIWLSAHEGGVVAPTMNAQGQLVAEYESFSQSGLGHLTRIYGTKPLTPRQGLETVISRQRWLADHTRLRIAALVHEECLTGLAAWTATTFPTPLAWGATFDPDLAHDMGSAIGETMEALGIHQGLAPVLDVITDPRFGRVEECISEDPYVIATIAKGYIEGIQKHGPLATLKHFIGYSGSKGGRNLGPVHAGWREIEDLYMLPFEVGILDAGVGSVMNAYPDIDGVPVAVHEYLLTGILRDRWGFTGTCVADYFAVAFIMELHQVAENLGDAAAQALKAGIDVELPTGNAFREPLETWIETHPETLPWIDRALARVLTQKEELGLLDIDTVISTLESKLEQVPETLDPPAHRQVARRIAEESVVLLDNSAGLLPLGPETSIAVIGPNADRQAALFGCYSFVNHVLAHNPGVPSHIEAPTILEALSTEFTHVSYAQGCSVRDQNTDGFAQAVSLAESADVVIAVMGDQSGLFGEGTSGEGCDTDSLNLPGVQEQLLEALYATGTPVVLVAVTGRPYALGPLASKAKATVQSFFPGEEGASAIAGVLTGRVNPSGRLPVSMPACVGSQPFSYLHAKLGEPSDVTTVNSKPWRPFGYGESYTSFEYTGLQISESAATDGWIQAQVRVRNTGQRDGSEVVQLYGHDLVASIAPRSVQLLGYARLDLEAGAGRDITMRIPAARFAFHNRDMKRVVEPGGVELWFGSSSQDEITARTLVHLTGGIAEVTKDTPRLVEVVLSY